MREAQPNPFVHQIRHLIGGVSAATLTDGQLLEQFLANHDETAVEVLVRRHGPLVFSICRRVLHNAHAAEDAFQATFLVLIRKAVSLDLSRPLGAWLGTVAYRLALRAHANEMRRRRCEEQAVRNQRATASPAGNSSDLLIALEEELHRLPERHRVPLLLCYLEGKTNEQAAALLGCPRGSMAARLAQARERLRESLARRGFVVPAAGIAAALATLPTQAAVPLPLLDVTVRGALWFAREEGGGAGPISAQVIALARGAFRTVFLNRLKIAGGVLLAVALLGTGASMLLRAGPQASPVVQAARQERAEDPEAVPGPGANAALCYGQAFIALRRGFGDEDKLIGDCLTMPLDASAREMVTRAAYALRMLQRGAALQRCDWASDTELGIDTSYVHAKGALMLASLACLSARLHFEEGRNTEALSDIVAALALARNVSRDGILDSLRAGYQIEQRVGETLALYLPRLDAGKIKDLQRRLEALPQAGRPGTATLRMAQAMLSWIEGEVKEAKDKESLLSFLTQVAGTGPRIPEKRRAQGQALLEECGGTAAGVLKSAAQMRQRCAALAKTLDLPADQVAREFEREEKKLAGNPVYRIFAPVLDHVRLGRAEAEVRQALLSAALAVQLDGRDVLKNHRDPVVGGPLELVPFEGGFELRSRLKGRDDKPVSLTVGRKGK